MEPPQSRFRVVEKDGRLIVIDNGEPVETLVKHSHDVLTPGKRRRLDRDPPVATNSRAGRPSVPAGGKSTISLPVGPGGEAREVEITGGVMGRFVMSLFALMLLFVFGGVFLIFGIIILSIILGGTQKGREPLFKRLFRLWARWVAGA